MCSCSVDVPKRVWLTGFVASSVMCTIVRVNPHTALPVRRRGPHKIISLAVAHAVLSTRRCPDCCTCIATRYRWGMSCPVRGLASSPSHAQVVTLWFDMKVWESIVAILFGIPLAVICIQCTGETDTTPTGAVGKVRFCDMWMRAGNHGLGSVCVVGILVVGYKLRTHE